MSNLQKLGRELDYFYEDVRELLPEYTSSIMYPLHNLFLELITTGISYEEEVKLIDVLYDLIQDIQNEWRGILSEAFDKN